MDLLKDQIRNESEDSIACEKQQEVKKETVTETETVTEKESPKV